MNKIKRFGLYIFVALVFGLFGALALTLPNSGGGNQQSTDTNLKQDTAYAENGTVYVSGRSVDTWLEEDEFSDNSYIVKFPSFSMRINGTSYSISGSTAINLPIKTTLTFTVASAPSGYRFAGWWRYEDYSDDANDEYRYYRISTSTSMDIYTQWVNWHVYPVPVFEIAPNLLTVNPQGGTFDSYDGWSSSGLNKNRLFGNNEYYYYKLPTVSRTGYDFKGWFTSPSGGTQITSSSRMGKSDITIYAQWTAKASEITLNDMGATTSGTKTIKAIYGNPMPAISLPIKTGYDFGGYWTNSNGTGTQYYTADGKSARNWDKITTQTIELYAKWTANSYLVTVDGNGGEVNGWNSKTITFGTNYDTLPTVTRTGYTFAGWKNSVNGEILTSTTKMTTAENHLLIAQWTENEYTISFDCQASKTLQFTEEYVIESGVTKFGHQLLYWQWNGEKYYEGESVNRLSATNGAVLEFNGVWQETWLNHAIRPEVKNGIYQIASAENLAWLGVQTNFEGECEQVTNIDLGAYYWEPIGESQNPFRGTYDGKGYIIKNLNTISEKDKEGKYVLEYGGLFGVAINASFKNIYIMSGNICGESAGGIVAVAGYGIITNCINRAKVNGNEYVGGIVGSILNMVITSSYNYGEVKGDSGIGGIAGFSDGGNITKCYVKATIEGNGILGVGEAEISRSGFDGLATGEAIGGENMTDCFANGAKYGTINAGNWTTVGGKDIPKGLVI